MSSREQKAFLLSSLSDSGQLRELKLTKTHDKDVEIKHSYGAVIRWIINESVHVYQITHNQLDVSFIKEIRVEMDVKKKLTGVLVKDEEK